MSDTSFIHAIFGTSTQISIEQAGQLVDHLLTPEETVCFAFKLVRDLVIFTNKRIIYVDKQKISGKKAEYLTIPYKRIVMFSIEDAGGMLDWDLDFKFFVQGESMPRIVKFKKGTSLNDLQLFMAGKIL